MIYDLLTILGLAAIGAATAITIKALDFARFLIEDDEDEE